MAERLSQEEREFIASNPWLAANPWVGRLLTEIEALRAEIRGLVAELLTLRQVSESRLQTRKTLLRRKLEALRQAQERIVALENEVAHLRPLLLAAREKSGEWDDEFGHYCYFCDAEDKRYLRALKHRADCVYIAALKGEQG